MTGADRVELSVSGRKCWWFHCNGKPTCTVSLGGSELKMCASCAKRLESHPHPKRYMELVAPWALGKGGA